MTDDIFDFPSDIMFYPPFVPDDVHADAMEDEVADLQAALRTSNEEHSREVGELLVEIYRLQYRIEMLESGTT